MRNLLEAGVHFGHQTQRWNPKMRKYIFMERNGIYILDLQKTVSMLEKARKLVREVVGKGGTRACSSARRSRRGTPSSADAAFGLRAALRGSTSAGSAAC